MTLIYQRAVQGQATHAFVVGCGRFPHLDPSGSADRRSTAAGAREVVRFLLREKDNLIAPLASIEILLSDPGNRPGQDRLNIGPFDDDPRQGDDTVEPALHQNAEKAGNEWIGRCKPTDRMVFYMASHGVAERDGSALGLLEDANSLQHARWRQAVDVTSLARGLPTISEASLVLLDACREIVEDLVEQPDGSNAIKWLTPNVRQLALTPSNAVSLAAARFGDRAWAPRVARPPRFTQAFLDGYRHCVESLPRHGYVVTGKQLINGLSNVAFALSEPARLIAEPIVPFNHDVPLLRVTNVRVPVAVYLDTLSDINRANRVAVHPANGTAIVRTDQDLVWRFQVDPDGRQYEARAEFPAGGPDYASHAFIAFPPASIVMLVKRHVL